MRSASSGPLTFLLCRRIQNMSISLFFILASLSIPSLLTSSQYSLVLGSNSSIVGGPSEKENTYEVQNSAGILRRRLKEKRHYLFWLHITNPDIHFRASVSHPRLLCKCYYRNSIRLVYLDPSLEEILLSVLTQELRVSLLFSHLFT